MVLSTSSCLHRPVYIVLSTSSCLHRPVYIVLSTSSYLHRPVYIVLSTSSCLHRPVYIVLSTSSCVHRPVQMVLSRYLCIGVYRIRIFRIRPEPDLPDFFTKSGRISRPDYPVSFCRIIWPEPDFYISKIVYYSAKIMRSEKNEKIASLKRHLSLARSCC